MLFSLVGINLLLAFLVRLRIATDKQNVPRYFGWYIAILLDHIRKKRLQKFINIHGPLSIQSIRYDHKWQNSFALFPVATPEGRVWLEPIQRRFYFEAFYYIDTRHYFQYASIKFRRNAVQDRLIRL